MKRIIFLLLLLMANLQAISQLDVKHYIPPLYGRTNVQNHYMILSTPSTTPVTVNVKNGQGTLIYSTVITDVAPNVTLLGTGYAAPGIINTAELNMVNPTDGFIIDATAPIYVNVRHVQSAQGLSLTSKGAGTGLGTRFRSGHIYSNPNIGYVKAHEISVMATQNNTTVTFSDISPNVVFRGTPTTAGTSNNISVTLNAGESYTIAAWVDEPGATGNLNDVNGTLITSDKPIACNTGSWLSGADGNGRDIGVDQIVPVDLIGSEYIFVEGDGNANTERPLVVAEYDNTAIYVNGSGSPIATINAGDYFYLPQSSYSANDNIYISTSQPIYMYQSLSGSNTAATSLNFIPPLRCNGFKKVVIPSVNLVGAATVSITARANANVYINGSATPLTGGLTVPGNACWITYKIPGGAGDFTVESDSIINVALLTLQGVRGSAGYFTGFAQFTQIDQGDTSSFVVCSDSASSYVTYSIEGPYLSATADFYNPSLNGQITIDGFNADTLFFTYIGDPNTIGTDSLDLTVCKLLDCCGAIADTICEVTTLIFTNIADINTGLGDSIFACPDTTTITVDDLLLGPVDAGGFWVDDDNSGALFGNSFDVSAVSPGIYHFTYVVASGQYCVDSTTTTVNVLPMSSAECCAIDPTFVLNDPTCNGFTDGSILITDDWATDFSIDGGTTTQQSGSFGTIGANSYNINLSWGPDCTFDTTIIVNEPAVLGATFSTDSVSCNGVCDGQITVNTTGGTTPYEYSLGGAPVQASNIYSNLCAGVATITITDSNNCQTVLPETVYEPALLTISETAHINETCTNANGSTTVSGSGGTAPYNYSINAGPQQSSGTFSNLAAGTYNLIVTDDNGCTAQLNVTITNAPGPIPFVDVLNDVACFGGLNGSVTIGVVGGTAPLQFSLDAGANQPSNNFPAVGAGNHTVLVTDVNGCTNSVNFNIQQPTPLTYTTAITHATCNGVCDGIIDISASGSNPPYTYSSDNGNTFYPINPLTGLCAGNVNVVVKDATGCLANSIEIINEPTPVNSVQGFVDPECHQTLTGEISFAPSGGTPGYQFSVDGGTSFVPVSPITNLMAGVYDVVVEDANGCQFTEQITLIDPPPFTFTFLANNPSNCGANDGSFEIIADAGTPPYLYSINGGVTQQGNGFFGSLFSGLYNLVVEDANGCFDSTYSALSDNVMTTQVDFLIPATCHGGCDGLAIVSQQFGAPPFTYTLQNGLSQADGNFFGLCAGQYFVTIQDGGLCIGIQEFIVGEPDSITFDNTLVDITCPGGSDGEIHFTNVIGGNGGPYTYSIDGGGSFVATSSFTGLSSGTYSVQAKDGNGCIGATQVTLDEPNPFTVYISASDLTCNGNNTGFIQVVAGGATSPYTYTVSGTNATGIFVGIAANNYAITITDANGCTYDTSQVINEPAALTALYSPGNALCFGSTDGTIAVVASGGTTPYLYSPNNGITLQSSAILSGLGVGCYDAYVQDDNGCTTTSLVCINEPTLLTMTITTTPATCGNNNGTISITAGNGTPGYQYSNNNGLTFQAGNQFIGLATGSYDLILKDANGCTIDSTINVTADPLPVINNVTISNPLCFGGTDGSITVTSSSGVGAHQYSITSAAGPFQGSNIFNGLGDGTYSVYVQDANGCVASMQADVVEPTQIQIVSIATDLTCYQNNTGQINMTSTNGGTNPYQFSINNGSTFQGVGLFTGLSQGTYDLVVQDANGCQMTGTETVNEPTPLIFDVFTVDSASCYGLCDAVVTANASGGSAVGTYTYTWSGNIGGPADDQATNVCAGTYSLIVHDDNGCSNDTLNFVVGQPDQAIIDSVITTDVLCWGDVNGIIDIYSSNAGFYSIDNINFSASNNFTGLATGFYTAYVQDVNGCPGDSASVYVGTPQELNGFVTPDEYICQGDSIFFSAVATGGTVPYTFDVNNGASNNPVIYEPIINDTSYFVYIVDANGCDLYTDTMIIDVAPPPILTVSNDTVICEGEYLALFGEAADLLETYTYLWNTGDTITYIYPTVTTDTLFYVTATDECGLTTTDSIFITIFDDPIISLIPDVLGGCPPFQINYTIGVDMNDLASDLFFATDYGTIDSSNFTNLYITYVDPGSGTISVSFTSTNGCPVDTSFINLVDVYPLPIADFYFEPAQPDIFDVDLELINTSTNYDSNIWFFLGDTVFTQDATLLLANAPVDTTVTICLVVMNQFGCSDTTCNDFMIENELFLYVPNAILLDGYSQNSIFLPTLNYFHPDWYDLYIFNRWGELLFHTDDVTKGWDGTYNGIQVQDGVYVWKIVGAPLENESDLRTYTGHVTVLK
ncbi:MAG: gliding motility-associated C-terminal domain-containing protein [Crocinitomicaceae bacterium]